MTEQLDLFYASVEEEKPSENDLQDMFDKKNKQKHLTSRQWRLLDFIKINSVVERRKTTQREIVDNVPGYEWNDDEKCHDHCPAIWNDIKDINLSYETDKLIISDKFEYWIGNEQETKDFIDKLWNDLSPRLTRYWNYLKKVNRDGQGVLIDRKGTLLMTIAAQGDGLRVMAKKELVTIKTYKGEEENSKVYVLSMPINGLGLYEKAKATKRFITRETQVLEQVIDTDIRQVLRENQCVPEDGSNEAMQKALLKLETKGKTIGIYDRYSAIGGEKIVGESPNQMTVIEEDDLLSCAVEVVIYG